VEKVKQISKANRIRIVKQYSESLVGSRGRIRTYGQAVNGSNP
jgi:hypothetical protein